MNKIYIEASIGELIDKITILEIKRKKIQDKNSLEIVNKEYSSLTDTMEKNLVINDKIKNLWEELREINLKLWEIEDSKRLAEKNKKFDENFIELARNVNRFNDKRAKIKSQINQLSGSSIREIKHYTKY